MNYHLIVLIDMQYIKNHKEETMPLRDENTKIRSIDDEQDTEISYFFGQELTNNKIIIHVLISY